MPRLVGRGKTTFDWIAPNTKLLDIGCAHGSFTRIYAEKVKSAIGVDVAAHLIKQANDDTKHIPNVRFKVAPGEKLPFKPKEFDVVVLNDIVEHVPDERKALKEASRVLKKGGSMIITVPHKGLFGFIDVDNIVYYSKKHVPILYKLAYLIRKKQWPKEVPFVQGYDIPHKHYTKDELLSFLPKGYELEDMHRGAFFLYPVGTVLRLGLHILLGDTLMKKVVAPFLQTVFFWEYYVPFGSLGYVLAVKVRKK